MCEYSLLCVSVCVTTMRWVQQPPGPFPWVLGSGRNAAGRSTSSACCIPRNPSSHLPHSVKQTHPVILSV